MEKETKNSIILPNEEKSEFLRWPRTGGEGHCIQGHYRPWSCVISLAVSSINSAWLPTDLLVVVFGRRILRHVMCWPKMFMCLIGIVVYVCILRVSDWHRRDLYSLMVYMLSSLGHKTPLSTSVKYSCIFLSRREGSKGEGKQNWWNLGWKYSRSCKEKVVRWWILMLHLLLHNFTSMYESHKALISVVFNKHFLLG